MKYELKNYPTRKKYSNSELKLFGLISQSPAAPSSTTGLINGFYDVAPAIFNETTIYVDPSTGYQKTNIPDNPYNSIVQIISRLQAKLAYNREPFIIAQSKQLGPYPMLFWIAPRERTNEGELRAKTGINAETDVSGDEEPEHSLGY